MQMNTVYVRMRCVHAIEFRIVSEYFMQLLFSAI